jgi:hypothetical protein
LQSPSKCFWYGGNGKERSVLAIFLRSVWDKLVATYEESFVSCIHVSLYGHRIYIVWDVTPHSLVEGSRHFGGTYCFHLQDLRVSHESRVDSYLASNVVHSRSDDQLYLHTTVHEVTDSKPDLQAANADSFYFSYCLVTNLLSI